MAQTACSTLVLMMTLLVTLTNAASSRPSPLSARGLLHPQSIQTRIIPRSHRDGHHVLESRSTSDPDSKQHPKWDDKWLLSFTVDDEPVTISLRPSHSLVHPEGIKSVHTHVEPDGTRTTREEIIRREDVLAFEGFVLNEQHDLEEWVRGEQAGLQRDLDNINEHARDWAKIVIVPRGDDGGEQDDDEGDIRFQGSYSRQGEAYTIHSTRRYLATRDHLDPEPPLIQKRGVYVNPDMVIVRERAVVSTEERINEMRKRGIAVPDMATITTATSSRSCGHDDLSYNADPMNPVFAHAYETTPWSDSFFGLPSGPRIVPEDRSLGGLTSRALRNPLVKRQGDIATGGGTNASSNFINSIGSTTGCPRQQQVLFMGVAADCSYTQSERRPVILLDLVD